ncbi:hypothetical protein BpHYR1_046708 [Brachionus plicatilis]|uniref:Uncharacterized protein n=1 Tax=Brachionus plicatilis TaxID=10195 RepID=A0A3M7Q0J5_BRAPC|nr:hypothetical protein BpHYR1_046708 [Brachionus plicatilis]
MFKPESISNLDITIFNFFVGISQLTNFAKGYFELKLNMNTKNIFLNNNQITFQNFVNRFSDTL